MLTKCVKCGEIYVFESDDKISDFECDCGGELVGYKESSKTQKNTNNSSNNSNKSIEYGKFKGNATIPDIEITEQYIEVKDNISGEIVRYHKNKIKKLRINQIRISIIYNSKRLSIILLNLETSKKIVEVLKSANYIIEVSPDLSQQNVLMNRQYKLQIRETTIGTFGHHQENFDTAVVDVASDELRISKKGIMTGRDRGHITLKYLDIISVDEDRGWVLTTVQIRMSGNHTVNLRANKEVMRNFFTVMKQAVDTCKEREKTRETKARQMENESKRPADNISDDPVDKLVKLAKLLEDGLIDEKEFATMKAKIMNKG